MKEVTLDDHLNNIGLAISKATMTGAEFENVRASFLHIIELLKKEEPVTPKENVS
jgi:hypothetical protein